MPKVKTKSGAKKRFKLTGTGKVKRKHAFKSHILTRRRAPSASAPLTRSGLVSSADMNRVSQMLNI